MVGEMQMQLGQTVVQEPNYENLVEKQMHITWIVKLQKWQTWLGTSGEIVISASGLSDVCSFKNDRLKGELVEPFWYGLTFFPLFTILCIWVQKGAELR